jgi:hypothetical protein
LKHFLIWTTAKSFSAGEIINKCMGVALTLKSQEECIIIYITVSVSTIRCQSISNTIVPNEVFDREAVASEWRKKMIETPVLYSQYCSATFSAWIRIATPICQSFVE